MTATERWKKKKERSALPRQKTARSINQINDCFLWKADSHDGNPQRWSGESWGDSFCRRGSWMCGSWFDTQVLASVEKKKPEGLFTRNIFLYSQKESTVLKKEICFENKKGQQGYSASMICHAEHWKNINKKEAAPAPERSINRYCYFGTFKEMCETQHFLFWCMSNTSTFFPDVPQTVISYNF